MGHDEAAEEEEAAVKECNILEARAERQPTYGIHIAEESTLNHN